MSNKIQISKEMTIGAILDISPHHTVQLIDTIQSFGLACVGCGSAAHETLEQGIRGHGGTDAHVELLVDRINEVLATTADPGASSPYPGFQLELSDRAVAKIRALLESPDQTGKGLRMAVIDGGCAGMSYDLSFRDAAAPTDDEIEIKGLRLFVDRASQEYLHGTSIDFVDELNRSGFVYSNPNAAATCGCGSSFA